jgi:hypothetical protein
MLPPSMGRFPLYDVSSFAERLPNEIAGRGGIFFPMYEREAMWISFQTSTLNEDGIKQYAIRPFVGGGQWHLWRTYDWGYGNFHKAI